MESYFCILFKIVNMKKNLTHLIFSLFFLSLFLFSCLSIKAQPAPIKFGVLEKSVLEMKSYENDTTADAVIICDYGEFNPATISFSRITRIKILKKSGCDYANRVLRAPNKSNIKGITYNLMNGEIQKTKLENESIFMEDIGRSYYRYRITMPNVKEGSVIDIQATFSGIPSVWYFQSNIPVVWSELRLEPRAEIGIQKNFFGFHPLSIVEDDRWVSKNVPALKEEPYMNDLSNFLTKYELEFSYINIPRYLIIDYASSWEAVNYILLNKSTFGDELKTLSFMKDEAESIKKSFITKKEQLLAAYDTIKKKIKWNEIESLFPIGGSDIKFVLKNGMGNAGEVNISLILLLKRLDIEAYPVALSTRENGLLSLINPTFNKLNYLIVLAKIDGEDFLLDATEEYLPLGYLPIRCINNFGILVNSKKSVSIDLAPGGVNKTDQLLNLTINPEGSITGDIQLKHSKYAAYLFRKNYNSLTNKDEYFEEQERTNPGLNIKEYTIEEIDSINKPVLIKETIEYTSNINVIDSLISFTPIISDRLLSNPFYQDKRNTPIDFIVPIEHKYYYNYNIPIGYKTESMPKSINMKLLDGKANFIFQVDTSNSSIQILVKYSISNVIFTQNEYEEVKHFFTEIIKKESESIILKKY